MKKRGTAAGAGFSTIDLTIVAMVVAVLLLLLIPGMNAMVHDARLSNVKQDAFGIGSAIEIIIVEGRFDPSGEGLMDLIYYKTGMLYEGEITELQPDGSFVYSKVEKGETIVVRYDQATGSVDEVRN